MHQPPPQPTLFPYTTLFRSESQGTMLNSSKQTSHLTFTTRLPLPLVVCILATCVLVKSDHAQTNPSTPVLDRKSTRLNSSHGYISYAVFCLNKKKFI